MDEVNEDELIIYEESKEINETIWKIWDIINDIEIIRKLLLNSSLIKYLKEAHSKSKEIFDSIENCKEKQEEKIASAKNKISEEDGK